jgi:hypothetical protein
MIKSTHLNLYRLFLIIAIFQNSIGCKNSTYDGKYCAIVHYYNPNTGTQSDYNLIITAEDNQLERIDFPQGYLDESQFKPATLSNSGNARITTWKGYVYTVDIIGPENGCFDNVPKAVQCKGITKKGNRCKKLTDKPNGLCWQHRNQ